MKLSNKLLQEKIKELEYEIKLKDFTIFNLLERISEIQNPGISSFSGINIDLLIT